MSAKIEGLSTSILAAKKKDSHAQTLVRFQARGPGTLVQSATDIDTLSPLARWSGQWQFSG